MTRAILALALIAVLAPVPAQADIGGLVWSDEFNAGAGTGPDGSKWVMETGGAGWGNNELQYYTNRTSNAAHDGAGNWSVNADGTIRALGKCLDAAGPSSADGTRLHLWTCHGGANQRWALA